MHSQPEDDDDDDAKSKERKGISSIQMTLFVCCRNMWVVGWVLVCRWAVENLRRERARQIP